MFKRLRNLLDDPFGRRRIREVHDPILRDIRVESVRVREQRKRNFPISSTVSNQRLREEISRNA